MNRMVKILLPVFLFVFGASLSAQPKSGGQTPPEKGKLRVVMPDAYLGRSSTNGGQIKKADFDKLLKQGITAHDSAGNKYKVIGFEFGYAEKSLYEDEAGNLQVGTDYLDEYCPGDTVSHNVSGSIYERTKPGDTVYIDRIKVVGYVKKTTQTLPETEAILAKPMKFVIIK
jgi:hypothetical protein